MDVFIHVSLKFYGCNFDLLEDVVIFGVGIKGTFALNRI